MIGTPSKASASNDVATVTIAARDTRTYTEIRQIIFSYSAAPTNGKLTVESPSGTEILDVDITAAGCGPIITGFRSPTKGAAVLVKLAAGGSGITGKLTVIPAE